MFCKGDGSSASSVDLLRRDFRAMMYYDFFPEKSFQECFQSLKHWSGDQSASKATVLRWFSQFMSEEREHWKTVTVVVEWHRPLLQKMSLR